MDATRDCDVKPYGQFVAHGMAFALVLSAGAVTFDGTGDWPTGGDVELTATVQVDDSHVADVVGWQTLSIASGCRLNFVNTGTAATLAATVSGAGKVGAVDSVGLAISGDNRNFTGGFVFTNSAVTVANEYGLGGPSTAAADVSFTASGTLGALDFQGGGQTAFTNHCPLKFACDRKYTGAKAMYLGSLAADEYFVQDADFTVSVPYHEAASGLHFRNNCEFVSGTFRSDKARSLFVSADDGANIVFSGTTRIWLGANATTFQIWYAVGKAGTYRFSHSGGTRISAFCLNIGSVVLGGDELFLNGESSGLQTWQPYMQTQTTYANRLDLNGHDAKFHLLKAANDSVKSSDNTSYSIVTSDVAAAVCLVGDGKGVDNTVVSALEFQGKASLMVDNNATNRLATRVSSPDGTLRVKSGALVYQWNGGWDGTAVVVEGGAIVANSARAFSGGHSALTMTGGKLVLSSDYPVSFATATVGGVELDPNAYTVAELRDDYDLGAYFEGDDDAELRVVGTSGTWTGWPTEPGATAQVPVDATVYIHAADAANVSQLGKIVLGLGSTVICDTALSLNCPITGYGAFRIVDSTGVTILGDNSRLVSPGSFYIENSTVAVSNRFGLGGAKTGAATVKFSSLDNHLLFGLADCRNFTNDVALVIDQTGSSNVAVIGSQSPDETFVQNADITFKTGTTYAKRVTYTNNVEILSGTVAASGNLYLYGHLYSTLKVGPGCSMTQSGGASSATLAFYGAGYNVSQDAVPVVTLAPESFTGFATVMREITHLRLDAPNVFDEASGLKINYGLARAGQLGKGIIDLCGHDQSIGGFQAWSAVSRESSNPQYGIITSGEPAVLTQVNDDADLMRDALMFTGAAGYRYAGAGTNLLCNVKSTSLGDFRVSSGVAGFDWGAAWAGTNIVVEGTGVLYVGAESAPAFGAKASANGSGVTLRVNDGGKLYLEDGETFVHSAYLGGDRVKRGAWSEANCDWIEGSGTLRVLHDDAGFMLLLR